MATINTSKLKSYAREARQQFITQVGARVDYLLKADSGALREREVLINELRKAVAIQGRITVVTEAAYRWFNRLVALRFMDVNDYADLRAVSPVGEETLPELLSRALAGTLPDDLATDQRGQINDLLTGRLSSPDPQAEVYRLLLTAECHRRHAQLPFLFDAADGLDYDELLLPNDLLSDNSVLAQLRASVTETDCENEEIIGWLYQFYIAEKKDAVFASKGKVKKEDIPAVTQLFTPRWIVEYMVQNTLGKLWLRHHPDSKLRDHMPYYLESAEPESTKEGEPATPVNGNSGSKSNIENQESRIEKPTLNPEDLTLADQACGSGHILLYAFDLLTRIYEESGYSTREIPGLILSKNLTGFEIDGRAAQLAAFTLMMRARRYYRRALSLDLSPNIVRFQDLKLDGGRELPIFIADHDLHFSSELQQDLELMQQATNLGSLITPTATEDEILRARTQVQSKLEAREDLFAGDAFRQLDAALMQLGELAKKFWCVVDNPPYMGSGKMNPVLKSFVNKYYPEEKSDLMVAFMQRGILQTKRGGYVGMINFPSWMFLSSFEKFRKKWLSRVCIDTFLHLGRGIFGSDFGSCAFTVKNESKSDSYGVYRRLFKEHVQVRSVDKIEELFLNPEFGLIKMNQKEFAKIPGYPIGYWLSYRDVKNFAELTPLKKIATPKQGLSTTNNGLFLRYWFEVSKKKMSLFSGSKWFPYSKGGPYRKWYGNIEYVLNWENGGEAAHKYIGVPKSAMGAPLRGKDWMFKEGLAWSALSSGRVSFRYCPEGYTFDAKGPMLFPKNALGWEKILAVVNSNYAMEFLKVLAPTLDYNQGPIGKIPYAILPDEIEQMVKFAVEISKEDWSGVTTSFQFMDLPLLKDQKSLVRDQVDVYQKRMKNRFWDLHRLEEKMNSIVNSCYSLTRTDVREVLLRDVTILQEEVDETKLSEQNKKLIRDPTTGLVTNYDELELPFKRDVILQQFISYAVGCMMGRYSLDKEGLILANAADTLKEYAEKVGKEAKDWTFAPDDDGIIPVLQDDFFDDDIVNRFEVFLRTTFGDDHYSENLDFVEECIGKDIRTYFLKDFFDDHVKRYKRRPIYWNFVSPGGHFRALVYLHRYRSDTISRLLNDYLRDYVRKLEAARGNAIVTKSDERLSVSIRTQADKDIQRYEAALLDCREYATNILQPLAARKLELDLDDGVLVNYNKMGKAVETISNMNDAKGRKKVMGFDWVDFDWEA